MPLSIVFLNGLGVVLRLAHLLLLCAQRQAKHNEHGAMHAMKIITPEEDESVAEFILGNDDSNASCCCFLCGFLLLWIYLLTSLAFVFFK